MTISPHVAESIDRVLGAVRTHLRMDVAFVTQFLGSSRVFRSVDLKQPVAGISLGAMLPMASGYCAHVVAGRLPQLIADTSREPLALEIAETRSIPIGAHLSVPIQVEGGEVFGTFCCFSHRAMPELGAPELDLMHTFSRLIARELRDDVARDQRDHAAIERVQAAILTGDPRIVFQPVVRLSDHAVIGLEALSRFATEPRRTPDVWFQEAAAVGMGEVLEFTAVRAAIRAAHGLEGTCAVHVNLSPASLLSPRLALALSGFDPRRLVIEVTEHEPITDYGPIISALAPLRKTGIRVAIDDAGAGYSSLRHVLMMRPDIIKLDVSLTRSLDTDPLRQAMASALVEFSRRTGTMVIAEGVETEAELAMLGSVGIAAAQGFLIARPQPLADVLSAWDLSPG